MKFIIILIILNTLVGCNSKQVEDCNSYFVLSDFLDKIKTEKKVTKKLKNEFFYSKTKHWPFQLPMLAQRIYSILEYSVKQDYEMVILELEKYNQLNNSNIVNNNTELSIYVIEIKTGKKDNEVVFFSLTQDCKIYGVNPIFTNDEIVDWNAW